MTRFYITERAQRSGMRAVLHIRDDLYEAYHTIGTARIAAKTYKLGGFWKIKGQE